MNEERDSIKSIVPRVDNYDTIIKFYTNESIINLCRLVWVWSREKSELLESLDRLFEPTNSKEHEGEREELSTSSNRLV